MKILITGSNGFIGRNMREYLQKSIHDYEVYMPLRQELDCLQEDMVTDYLKFHKFDYVLHMAGCGGGIINKNLNGINPTEYDLRIFLNFAKNSKYFGRMYCMGSGAEYDKRYDIVNISEDEIGRSIPIDSYGLTKYTINQIIESSDNIYNFRLFGVFGKYEYYPRRFISLACCKTIKNLPLTIRQNVIFDYLWVEDLCRMIECFVLKKPRFHVYNLVSGGGISLMEICKIVLEVSNKLLPIYICKESLGKEYTASNSRFISEFPEFRITPIKRAINETYKWYQENEELIDMYALLYPLEYGGGAYRRRIIVRDKFLSMDRFWISRRKLA